LYYDDSGRGERGVDLLPDPRHTSRNNGYSASGDSDPGGNVPQPLRVPKTRRSTQPRAGQCSLVALLELINYFVTEV